MRAGPHPLLPLLRSRVQGDLLALLYLHPDRDYSLTEAAALVDASVKTVHTEASRLIAAGFVSDSRRGNVRLLRAVTDSPVSRPLTDLLAVTYGRPVNIRRVRPAAWASPDPADAFLASVRERPLVSLHVQGGEVPK